MPKLTDADRIKKLDEASAKIETKRALLKARAEYRKALANIKKK